MSSQDRDRNIDDGGGSQRREWFKAGARPGITDPRWQSPIVSTSVFLVLALIATVWLAVRNRSDGVVAAPTASDVSTEEPPSEQVQSTPPSNQDPAASQPPSGNAHPALGDPTPPDAVARYVSSEVDGTAELCSTVSRGLAASSISIAGASSPTDAVADLTGLVGAYLNAGCSDPTLESLIGITAEQWPDVERFLVSSAELAESARNVDKEGVAPTMSALREAEANYSTLPEHVAAAISPPTPDLFSEIRTNLLLWCSGKPEAAGCSALLSDSLACSDARERVLELDQIAQSVDTSSLTGAEIYADTIADLEYSGNVFTFIGCSPLTLQTMPVQVDLGEHWIAVGTYLAAEAGAEVGVAYVNEYGLSTISLGQMIPSVSEYIDAYADLPTHLQTAVGVSWGDMQELGEQITAYCQIDPRIRGCADILPKAW